MRFLEIILTRSCLLSQYDSNEVAALVADDDDCGRRYGVLQP